jgi:hypothetical protein
LLCHRTWGGYRPDQIELKAIARDLDTPVWTPSVHHPKLSRKAVAPRGFGA